MANQSNIERVQENVRKMQAQNAPEADVVGYLKSEGYTPTRFESAVANAKKVGGSPVEAGFGRSLLQGLTFNTADEIEAAFRAGAISGPEYENQLARVRAGIKQYEEQYPGRVFTGELVGGLLPTAAALIAAPFTGGATAPAAAAGAVLVRNENSALPLEVGSVQTIAVLGPNARVTRTQGGGSSSLQTIESVSLLDGLTERYGADAIRYRRGVSIDKLAPIIDDDTLRTPDGQVGWRVEYYDRDEVGGAPRRVDITRQTALTYFGAAPPGVDPFDFTVVVTGDFVPQVDGVHDVSLVITGMGSLSVQGEVVVDDPQGLLPRGREYFGFGSEEQLHGIPMKRGEPVRFVARMRTRAGFSALRIGIRAPEDPHEFERAVSLAAECDAAIVVVGTNDEWETGAARSWWSTPAHPSRCRG
ncbi:MAG: hypothetical protein EBX18_06515 [Actinobacteria bacterium]|nr:hypothetical protein [Actinomycetota bacterium]